LRSVWLSSRSAVRDEVVRRLNSGTSKFIAANPLGAECERESRGSQRFSCRNCG